MFYPGLDIIDYNADTLQLTVVYLIYSLNKHILHAHTVADHKQRYISHGSQMISI